MFPYTLPTSRSGTIRIGQMKAFSAPQRHREHQHQLQALSHTTSLLRRDRDSGGWRKSAKLSFFCIILFLQCTQFFQQIGPSASLKVTLVIHPEAIEVLVNAMHFPLDDEDILLWLAGCQVSEWSSQRTWHKEVLIKKERGIKSTCCCCCWGFLPETEGTREEPAGLSVATSLPEPTRFLVE